MIYVMGDIHGCFSKINKFINQKKDVTHILQCGDFGYWPRTSMSKIKNKDVKIHWCDGNHEDFKTLIDKNYKPNLGRNVFYQKRGSYITLPDGRNVLFMGGGLSIDKEYRTEDETWFKEEILTENDLLNLPDVNIDIVISHTAPEEFFVFPKDEFEIDPSRRILSYILDKYRPDNWYFGHFHTYKRGDYRGCKWTALSECNSYEKWYEIIS